MATFYPICGMCKLRVIKREDEDGNIRWNHFVNIKTCSGPYRIQLEAPGLNSVMEFDAVVKVNDNGSVFPVPLMYSDISLEMFLDDGVWKEDFSLPTGWELLSGFTGQHGYNGPVMHSSEFIGGGLEKHILETPGYWTALVVESFCGYTEESCTEESGCDCEPAGWALAHKEFTTTEGQDND